MLRICDLAVIASSDVLSGHGELEELSNVKSLGFVKDYYELTNGAALVQVVIATIALRHFYEATNVLLITTFRTLIIMD